MGAAARWGRKNRVSGWNGAKPREPWEPRGQIRSEEVAPRAGEVGKSSGPPPPHSTPESPDERPQSYQLSYGVSRHRPWRPP